MGQGPGLEVEAKLFAAALRAGVPGPEVLLVLEPDDRMGSGFVMDWIEGETLGAKIARSARFQGRAQDAGLSVRRDPRRGCTRST